MLTTLLIQIVLRLHEALVSPLMLIMVIVISWQYWKLATRVIPPKSGAIRVCLRLIGIAVLSGMGMGILGSVILVVTGINVAAAGLLWLWLAALLLMLVNPRYLCFAYAGGLVGMINLLTGWPPMDISQLMVLIATLHLLEALLIYTVGHHSALPMLLPDPQGRLVGGFTLQHFWPLPLVAAIHGNPGVVMPVFPEWWPLFNPGDGLLQLVGVLAVLGYAEITTTDYPVQRTHRSALYLMGYSVILLVLGLASFSRPECQWLAVLFAPLGHELVIYIGLQREVWGQQRWLPATQGVKLLWVVPGSPAQRAGLQSGDIITFVNGQPVNSDEELSHALLTSSRITALVAVRGGQELAMLLRKKPQQSAGILPVPAADVTAAARQVSRTWLNSLFPARTHKG